MANTEVDEDRPVDLTFLLDANARLKGFSAQQRIEWAFERLPGRHVVTSSFGVQAALMLHLVTRVRPDVPVILIDTGYLFPETYRFVDELAERLDLNLHVRRPPLSPNWLETRYGRLWEQGLTGIERYNRISKVEPLCEAMQSMRVGTWFAGLRRVQSESRAQLPIVRVQDGRFKLHPVVDWSNRDVHRYLRRHHLPYHPLWDKGYVSVGDTHTSRPLTLGMREQDTRFLGLKRECGLHD